MSDNSAGVASAGRQELLQKLLLLFASTTLGLAGVCVFLLVRLNASRSPKLEFPELPRAVTDAQRSAADNSWDLFTPVPDPLVSMTFLPMLKDHVAWATRVPLTTNSSGFRAPYEFVTKAPGTYRVVILGDSFVAAHAARFEDGVAPQLEELLRRHVRRAGQPVPRIEVYPVAVSGWNAFSGLGYLLHNLHWLRPDLVVHCVSRNDLDSAYGFVFGNLQSDRHDPQGLFGTTHMSIVSPSIFARTSVDALSPIASHLVPESKKRFAKASEMARQARDLLQRDHAAKYLLFLFDHDLGYGVLNSFGAFLPLDEILVANPGVATNNLMPVDGHPNRKGHRIFALGLAHSIAERRLLPIDQAALAAEGPETHYTLAALVATHQPVDAAMKKLTQDFYGVAKIPSEIVLEAGKVTLPSMYRSIFGGLLPTGLLSAKTVLLLRRTGAARKLELGIEIPRLPRVEPGLFSVLIDGEERPLVPVGEPTAAVSRFDVELGPAAESELVEITLLGGGCCMGAPDDAIDGVYAVEPRWGRLRFARIR